MQPSKDAIINVDLIGVANALDPFADGIAPRGAGVVIASMAGYAVPLPEDVLTQLANPDVSDLHTHPLIQSLPDSGAAYAVSKRINRAQVEVASVRWGRRGARVNTISLGIIATAMGQQELVSEHGEYMRQAIAASRIGRVGTPTDIANAATFLLGAESSFLTGVDLLVDGGVTAAGRVAAGVKTKTPARPDRLPGELPISCRVSGSQASESGRISPGASAQGAD